MKFLNILRFLLGATLLAAVSSTTLAQEYPNKPIRFIVPYPPGGASDILARILATKMSDSMGQSILVENRAGAGGNIGADLVAKSAPDGYTILIGNIGPNAISPALYPKLPYDPIKDFTPISLISSVPIVLVAHPSFPASNVKEVIALAKLKPGQFNYASAGNGSSNHLAMELFKSLAGINLTHVAYKGGAPAMTDLIAGHIQIAFDTLPVVLPYVRSGKIKAIALAGTKGSAVLPDLSTITDGGLAGYEASSWGGLLAPGGTPRDVVNKLNVEVNRALNRPEVRDALTKIGVEPVGTTPEQFAFYIEAEIRKWKRVVSEGSIKIE